MSTRIDIHRLKKDTSIKVSQVWDLEIVPLFAMTLDWLTMLTFWVNQYEEALEYVLVLSDLHLMFLCPKIIRALVKPTIPIWVH